MIFALLMLVAAQESTPNCDAATTQLDMNACAGRAFAAADLRLNAQWKHTLAHMRALDKHPVSAGDIRPSYSQALLTAQRAWLAYRDAHCVSERYYARGGSMEPMLYHQCRAELTKMRTEQLVDLAKDDG